MRRILSYTLATSLVAALVTSLAACGSPQKPMDKDEIRRNADDANADLDRESNRKADR